MRPPTWSAPRLGEEFGARVDVGGLLRHRLDSGLGRFGQVRRHGDDDLGEQVAGALLAVDTTSLDAQDPPAGRARGDPDLDLLTIEGVRELHGTEHTLLPDMIEVGSFIGLAAMTRSELTIRNVSFENLGIIPAQFARLGIRFEQHGDDIYIPQQEHYRIENFMDGSIMTIADAPWPGLTPDLLSVFLVVATQAKGSVLIHQKMFESRLFFVDKLIDMGAQIILCDPHRATVIGHDHQMRLRATRMTSPDIRAGVALLIAAMSAEGTSTIQNIEQIDRGYKDIDGRLNALGARITRVEE